MTKPPPLDVYTLAQFEALKSFARWVISQSCFEGCDLDGGSVQDQATTLGLLEEVAYDPAVHKVSEFFDVELGDTIYRYKEFMER